MVLAAVVFTLSGCNLAMPGRAVSANLEPTPTPTHSATPVSPETLVPPTATPTPTGQPTSTQMPSATAMVCRQAHGVVERQSLSSRVTGSTFPFRVYLPPCYDPQAQPGYPVLYLIHGLGYNEDQWERLGVGEAADHLIVSGVLPFLVVMPYDASIDYPPGDPFDEALLDELIPWVDRYYATRASREYRTVGGLSRGAAWALHLGLTHPDVFGAMGLHSLPIFWSEAGRIPQMVAAVSAEQMPRIYLDIGRGDPELSSVMSFEALLTKKEIPHEWHLNNGYHDETYWSAHVEQYLSWYAQGWTS